MPQTDALKKYLDAGMAFTSLTRSRAEQVVKDLVKAGDLQRSQAKEAIDELLERSKKNTETLAEQVRKEVDSQLSSLGLARKADVEKLEAELAKLKGSGGSGGSDPVPAKVPAKKAPAAKKAPPAKPAPAEKEPEKEEAAAKVPSAMAAPAKKASTPHKPARKAASAGSGRQMGVDSEMPAKKDGGDAKASPAKKAAKKKA